jgi:Xaa-Pro aminopeptidase
MVKSPYEIECIDRALRIAEEGANAVMQMLKLGVTERDAAALYAEDVVRRGGSPYLTLIGFGAGAALPAAAPSDRALRGGDLVRLDLGASARGYRADVARTAVMGVPGERQERVYEAIDAAQQAALDAVTPGAAAETVFEAAIAAARARDLPAYRRHHVGHGIGLAHWEPPLFRPGETTAIEAGMVVQVENAYYEHGWGGVHLKDTALVTRAGARVMNRTARGLVVLD